MHGIGDESMTEEMLLADKARIKKREFREKMTPNEGNNNNHKERNASSRVGKEGNSRTGRSSVSYPEFYNKKVNSLTSSQRY